MSSDVIEMACLGRPFRLGMLYDCRSDKLNSSETLWTSSLLHQARNMTTQQYTNTEVITEDSFEEKALKIDISGSIKLSVLSGLIEVSGSAKYLNDRKTSKQQSRVTLMYKSTTRFEQLTMDQLGNVEFPEVISKKTAMHVVSGVLYGADAFFVFDKMLSGTESMDNVNGQVEAFVSTMKVSISGKIGLDIVAKNKQLATNIQCKFYGDAKLEQNPTTFEEAVEVFKTLSQSILEKPKKVWLFPLSNLDSAAAKLMQDISVGLVSEAEQVIEELHDDEVSCSDLMKTEVCSFFPDMKLNVHKFKQNIREYRLEFSKKLSNLLPTIREGGKEEAELAEFIKAKEESPFSSRSLRQWLNVKEDDVKILKVVLEKLHKPHCFQFLSSSGDLEATVFEYDQVLCLTFQMLS